MRKFTFGQALSEWRITLCGHKLPKRGAAALRRFDFYCFKCFVSYFLGEDTNVVSSKCHQATRWKACSTKENKIDKRYSSKYDQAYGVIFLLHTFIRKTRFVFKNLTYASTHKRNFRIIFVLPGKCL
jgi:hypothetical protein